MVSPLSLLPHPTLRFRRCLCFLMRSTFWPLCTDSEPLSTSSTSCVKQTECNPGFLAKHFVPDMGDCPSPATPPPSQNTLRACLEIKVSPQQPASHSCLQNCTAGRTPKGQPTQSASKSPGVLPALTLQISPDITSILSTPHTHIQPPLCCF